MTTRVLCALAVLAATAVVSAQAMQMQLASAQVVLTTGGRPVLKLAADGPLAHVVEPAPAGAPVEPGRLRLRLYGVTATAGLTQQLVAPFVIQASADGLDTVLTVLVPGLAAGARLEVGPASRASELAIVVR